ncbi:MAG: hypothetical protein HQ568_05480 [Calditrichaeota bacterium]|nr:hypothetical protein [Calditrichota bacterium]
MEDTIRAILTEIKTNRVFDSHFIIENVIKDHSDSYLDYASQISAASQRTLVVHGNIGKIISSFEGALVEKQPFESISYNIHGNVSGCACWKKL